MAEARIGVVGTGFIARNFVWSVDRHDGFGVSHILTRRPPDSVEGIRSELLTGSLEAMVDGSDVVVETSGDPIWATEVVEAAVTAGKPVVTMNTEFHITTGSYFVGKGLVTEAEGDQPGCLASLHEDAVAMGFEPVAYGNMKGFLNLDPTREDMEFWGAKQGISLPMVTSFTDGTKVQAEQILVANHYGAGLTREGMLAAAVTDIASAAEALVQAHEAAGRPIADYVVSRELPHGVFIVAKHDERHAPALAYYKLGDGPYYTIIRNNIFVHLEIMKTVRGVLEEGTVLLDNSAQPELSLAAVAKSDLEPGDEVAQGIGSFELRGHAVRIEDHPNHVPIGLISSARMAKPLSRDQIVTFDDVELPASRAVEIWREIASL
jgi:predicted homoserine dehydrogenase-like protein